MDDSGAHLAANVRRLREARGLSQAQMARLAGLPRPTWASLEAGGANPTLGVLARTAAALSVSIEELIGPPRTAARRFAAGEVPERRRQGIASALLQRLLELTKDDSLRGYTLEVRVSNLGAIRLYERFGFRRKGIRRGYYTDNREDALIMWRDADSGDAESA